MEAAPNRVLWGTDWPHPNIEGTMPNDGELMNLLAEAAPDERVRKWICQISTAEACRRKSPRARCVSRAIFAMLRWTRWCDVFYQANVALRGLWPLLLVHRPWVVSHHSWYRRPDGRIAHQHRVAA